MNDETARIYNNPKFSTSFFSKNRYYILQTDSKYCQNVLREHTSNHIYFYSGQPYWIEKTGNRWNVKTRAYVNGKFTLNDVTSGNLDHNSGGSFFKENYFICWTERYIQTCPLSNSSMTVNTFDTIDTTQNGDVGSNFGFDSTATYPATAKEITSVDICNGVVTFRAQHYSLLWRFCISGLRV